MTGATGNVGRHVVDLLLAAGVRPRALTRTPDLALLPEDAEVMGGDLERPGSVTAALDGISTVFLNLSALGRTTAGFLTAAREQGVRRIVMLSSSSVQNGLGADEQPSMLASWHRAGEDLVEESGLEWTILRPGEFNANALWTWGEQLRATGTVRAAYGEAATAPIHEKDIAAVGVQGLLTDDHIGARYILTGPESLTQYDKVRLLAQATGLPFRFEEVSPEVAREDYLTRGMPAQAVGSMQTHFDAAVDGILRYLARSVGHPAEVTTAVPDVTGRPALTFAAWAAEHADAFRA
ncbi:NAD(P)H-binding protein [Streptomyces sp. NPDC087850]|uniref:NAD(P)H-binding protein n=1 Tax=Streptomyces sp. NPDC087850 TaxID=3365809 RepID=UPI003807B8B8